MTRAAAACSALFASVADGGNTLPGSDNGWKIADVAAHVAVLTEFYGDYARGRTEPLVDVSDDCRTGVSKAPHGCHGHAGTERAG